MAITLLLIVLCFQVQTVAAVSGVTERISSGQFYSTRYSFIVGNERNNINTKAAFRVTSSVQCAVRCKSPSNTAQCVGFTCVAGNGNNTLYNSGAGGEGVVKDGDHNFECERCYTLSLQDMMLLNEKNNNNNMNKSLINGKFRSYFMHFEHSFYEYLEGKLTFLHFPEGLSSPMMFIGKGEMEGHTMRLGFVEAGAISSLHSPGTEIDAMLMADFRVPKTIKIGDYDSIAEVWNWSSESEHPVGDFLEQGRAFECVVFVTDAAYTFYVDGKLVGRYVMSGRFPLSHFKHVLMAGDFQTLAWYR